MLYHRAAVSAQVEPTETFAPKLYATLRHHLVDQALRHLEVIEECLERWVLSAQLLAVVVDILQVDLDDNALGGQLPVEACVLGGVERHEVVGHDASSAIHHTLLPEGLETQ